jgi:hypothetical protein
LAIVLFNLIRMLVVMNTPKQCVWIAAFFVLVFAGSTFAGLKPFPLSAGQSGTVTCLEKAAISYTVYLPPGYSTNGTPLPILYTLNPSGGGMVTDFKTVCASLNIITVGIISSKNSTPWNPVLRDFYAVPRDIRQRVLFDPTAVFVGGLSGGAENSYVFSRFWSQHVSGVLAMGGWLGRQVNSYVSTDRVQTNLLVARTTGTTDSSANYFLTPDNNWLSACGAVVKDWSFSGGHATAPDSVKTACLQWLLSQRIPAGPHDQSDSVAQAASWRARIAAGDAGAVLGECVSTLMNQPRTWFALQAQLVVDDLTTNFASFRLLSVSNLAQGDFASDLFYYYARGAATNGDRQRYDCALKALTGISGTSGDRAGDVYYLLTKFNYPAPRLQMAASHTNLWLVKDAPGLSYFLQSRTNLVSDIWQDLNPTTIDLDTSWSTSDFNSALECGFYRVGALPVVGVSPDWPDNGGYGQ